MGQNTLTLGITIFGKSLKMETWDGALERQCFLDHRRKRYLLILSISQALQELSNPDSYFGGLSGRHIIHFSPGECACALAFTGPTNAPLLGMNECPVVAWSYPI